MSIHRARSLARWSSFVRLHDCADQAENKSKASKVNDWEDAMMERNEERSYFRYGRRRHLQK